MPALLLFRHRVAALVGMAAIALVAVTATSLLLGWRSERQVSEVELRYVPLLELNRDLSTLLTAVTKALEDAASAAEDARLAEADRLRDQLLARLAAGRRDIVANGGDPGALEAAFLSYYALGREVSALILADAASDGLADKVERMQAARARLETRLEASTLPERSRLAAAFDSARRTQRTAFVIEVVVAMVALIVMLLLSWAIIRRATRSLRGLAQGMERLAAGDFSQEIVVVTRDEFGDVARTGNQTARRLREYRDSNQREDWIKTAITGLAGEIAGDSDVRVLGRKALSYLARYLGAQVGVAYVGDDGGTFHLLDVHGAEPVPGPPAQFRLGETMLGQAASDDAVRSLKLDVDDPLRVRTALASVVPAEVVIVPFAHEGRVMGVLELGFTAAVDEAHLELLRRIRGALAQAFRVAESQQRTRALLDETRRQAEELREAYDTLEAGNRTLQQSEEQLQAQQEELRLSNEELAQQTAAVEAQRRAAMDKNEALLVAQGQLEDKATELARISRYKSEFLANMSHELRTPLNSIMILSQILEDNQDRNLDAKQVEFASVIRKSGDELLTLINDVLDLAKVEAGKQDLMLEKLPVADISGYVQRMFEAVAADKGLALEVELDPGAPEAIRSDRTRLMQILKNLVSNAIKFTAQGRVAVRIRPAGPEHVSIQVADTGIGIPADKQAWVFEAFAQADGGTSREYGGTGLGLSIARQLAGRLGGTLTLDSEVSAGSTFELRLPVAGPDESSTTTPAVVTAGAAAPPPVVVDDDRTRLVPGEPCLLVIEDEPRFAAVVVGLIRDAGFRAVVATTGRDGLALAERYRPTGILLDVGLPDVDGWSVMDRLRQSSTTRDIPVHILTASDGAVRARHMGAVGFLAKPASAEQIRSALHRLEAVGARPLGRVLLVEGDDEVRVAIRDLLTGTGIEVDAVATGPAARELLAAGSYDGVVQNLAVPDKDSGFELLAAIRASAAGESLPVVIHTGQPLTSDEIRRLEVHDRATLVVQGERSQERVLDETRLFLHRVRSTVEPVEAPAHDGSLAGLKVLVVDDDMRNVYSLSSALGGRSIDVLTASDGQEALDELDAHPEVDVVLMDIMMPRMDGHQAIRRIRQQPRFEQLPIIALTARTMAGERQQCLDSGASDFVPKPVDVDRLLALLRVWAR